MRIGKGLELLGAEAAATEKHRGRDANGDNQHNAGHHKRKKHPPGRREQPTDEGADRRGRVADGPESGGDPSEQFGGYECLPEANDAHRRDGLGGAVEREQRDYRPRT